MKGLRIGMKRFNRQLETNNKQSKYGDEKGAKIPHDSGSCTFRPPEIRKLIPYDCFESNLFVRFYIDEQKYLSAYLPPGSPNKVNIFQAIDMDI